MARGRKGKKMKDDNNNHDDYRSVKLALGTVILEPYRLPLITFISEMAIKQTFFQFVHISIRTIHR